MEDKKGMRRLFEAMGMIHGPVMPLGSTSQALALMSLQRLLPLFGRPIQSLYDGYRVE